MQITENSEKALPQHDHAGDWNDTFHHIHKTQFSYNKHNSVHHVFPDKIHHHHQQQHQVINATSTLQQKQHQNENPNYKITKSLT